MLAAEAERARTAQVAMNASTDEAAQAVRSAERKPSVNVRLPPVPARTARDQAAAKRRPTAGDHSATAEAVAAVETATTGTEEPRDTTVSKEPSKTQIKAKEIKTKAKEKAESRARVAAAAQEKIVARARFEAESKVRAEAEATERASKEKAAQAAAVAEAKASAEVVSRAREKAKQDADDWAVAADNQADLPVSGVDRSTPTVSLPKTSAVVRAVVMPEKTVPTAPRIAMPIVEPSESTAIVATPEIAKPTSTPPPSTPPPRALGSEGDVDEWATNPNMAAVGSENDSVSASVDSTASKSRASDDWVQDGSEGFVTPPTKTSFGSSKSKAASVDPVPEVPDGGGWAQIKYVVHFVRGRWQRRSAIKSLKEAITDDTSALDGELGALGAEVRQLGLDNRTLAAENRAIDEAEERKSIADREHGKLKNRQAEENNRFAEIEADRKSKVEEAESALDVARKEQGTLEAQRRGLRDKRKDVDRQQKGLVKAAEDRESEAEKMDMGDNRAGLRRSAEDLRRQAAGLHPKQQDIQRNLETLEKPMSQATAKVEALKGELESAKRSLHDAREGHGHRQSEIDAELKRKSRDLAQAEAEIKRRLVTLGTIVNLNRIEREEFVVTYARIDVLRGAIGSRTTEIDRLSAERDAYDKKTLTRGSLILVGVVLAVILLIAILIWAI